MVDIQIIFFCLWIDWLDILNTVKCSKTKLKIWKQNKFQKIIKKQHDMHVDHEFGRFNLISHKNESIASIQCDTCATISAFPFTAQIWYNFHVHLLILDAKAELFQWGESSNNDVDVGRCEPIERQIQLD